MYEKFLGPKVRRCKKQTRSSLKVLEPKIRNFWLKYKKLLERGNHKLQAAIKEKMKDREQKFLSSDSREAAGNTRIIQLKNYQCRGKGVRFGKEFTIMTLF